MGTSALAVYTRGLGCPATREDHYLEREARVRAAFLAARDRLRAPFVRTAFRAAADRAATPRVRAAELACFESDFFEAAERPCRFNTLVVARDRLRETGPRRRPSPAAVSCAAFRRV
jgi:hypothetical protein